MSQQQQNSDPSFNPLYAPPNANQVSSPLYPELQPPPSMMQSQIPQQNQPSPSAPPQNFYQPVQPQQSPHPQQQQPQIPIPHQQQPQLPVPHQPAKITLPGPPLPPNWEVRIDQNGKHFFADHSRKVTTYQDPRYPQTYTPSTPVFVQSAPVYVQQPAPVYVQQPSPVQVQKTVVYENRSVLDPGYWISGPTASRTVTTVTTHPNQTQIVQPVQTNKTVVVTSNPLPVGWEMRVDAQGRQYFIDHNTKFTTYNDPRIHRPY